MVDKAANKSADKTVVTRAVTGGSARGWWRARRRAARSDAGMTTSEYAVGTIAAAAFAAVLYKIVTSGTVSGALESMIGRALDAPF
ncbi:DUF4244 domain-containing protein [Streptomyces sp. NPDC042898]|uniref:DUF4244 domain-containing protein n=1 Tax=unclassified Streptomyces TaxID=2593676 RepID=UPI00332B940A